MQDKGLGGNTIPGWFKNMSSFLGGTENKTTQTIVSGANPIAEDLKRRMAEAEQQIRAKKII